MGKRAPMPAAYIAATAVAGHAVMILTAAAHQQHHAVAYQHHHKPVFPTSRAVAIFRLQHTEKTANAWKDKKRKNNETKNLGYIIRRHRNNGTDTGHIRHNKLYRHTCLYIL